jgi:AMMECR1 domain-containing protein
LHKDESEHIARSGTYVGMRRFRGDEGYCEPYRNLLQQTSEIEIYAASQDYV